MAPIGKVDGTDWKGGWHRLERWMAPIGKVDGTDWKSGWHRLERWMASEGDGNGDGKQKKTQDRYKRINLPQAIGRYSR
jgi:hypothetical protein